MAVPTLPVLLLALAAPALLGADADGGTGQITTMTYHERIIVRVPRLLVAPPVPVTWKEGRGTRCIVAAKLAGALVSQPGVVDLVLVGERRVRARLDGACEPLDFYTGFYLKPAADGKVCAGRDSIRARSGASCQIDTFHRLKAAAAGR